MPSGFRRRLTGKSFSAKAKDSSGENPRGRRKPKGSSSEFDWGSTPDYREVLRQASARGIKISTLGAVMKQLNISEKRAFEIFVQKLMSDGANQQEAIKQARELMDLQYRQKK